MQAGRGCRRCGARPAPSLRARVPRRRPQIPASAPQKADRGRPALFSLQEGASAVAKGELQPPPSTPGVPRQGLPHISSPRAAPGYPLAHRHGAAGRSPPLHSPFIHVLTQGCEPSSTRLSTDSKEPARGRRQLARGKP